MKRYDFYGWDTPAVKPLNDDYPGIGNQRDLYDALRGLWQADTCTARCRDEWSEENPTLGQCTITAFLAQDIFGGKVYGVLRPGGNYHCFNVVGDVVFDLTSEQFGEEAKELNYDDCKEQSREYHFSKDDKFARYEKLKARLREATAAAK